MHEICKTVYLESDLLRYTIGTLFTDESAAYVVFYYILSNQMKRIVEELNRASSLLTDIYSDLEKCT
jgi:hypothetical protein